MKAAVGPPWALQCAISATAMRTSSMTKLASSSSWRFGSIWAAMHASWARFRANSAAPSAHVFVGSLILRLAIEGRLAARVVQELPGGLYSALGSLFRQVIRNQFVRPLGSGLNTQDKCDDSMMNSDSNAL